MHAFDVEQMNASHAPRIWAATVTAINLPGNEPLTGTAVKVN